MATSRELALLAALLSPIAGCTAGGTGDEARDASRDASRDAARGGAPAAVGADSTARIVSADTLRLRLEVPREVRRGAPVPFAFHVENLAGRPLTLYLRGRAIAFDIVVTDADGRVVWRRLEDEAIEGILQLREMAPGETLTLRASWNQRTARGDAIGDGEYRAHAELLTETDPLVGTPEAFRIVAPR